MTRFKLRMTGRQHGALFSHLYPGDGKEAISLGLCGVGTTEQSGNIHRVIMVHELHHIPYNRCSVREEDRITWSTDGLEEILIKAEKKGMILLKIHSHPSGYSDFSKTDDQADLALFPRVSEWIGSDFSGLSAVMLPDGRIFARAWLKHEKAIPIDSVLVSGPDIKFWQHNTGSQEFFDDDLHKRTLQAFGKGTTQLLSKLHIGVIGVSGTGSPVVEQLFRLGVGSLLLIDGDIVKKHNVGRIINSSLEDAKEKKKKVEIASRAIRHSGLPTKVEVIERSILKEDVLREINQCDILFGCMDSIEGRDILNRLAVFYSIPYFDLGIRLDADGNGGISGITGAVHYMQPDGSSLLSRGVYTSQRLYAEVLKRTNPQQYQQNEDEGYIKGVVEDRPAVISVNTLTAAFAVNDLLCRVHPHVRMDGNEEVDCIRVSLTHNYVGFEKEESKQCELLSKFAGRGDMKPFLNTAFIEEVNVI